jgi:hypothetical protein
VRARTPRGLAPTIDDPTAITMSRFWRRKVGAALLTRPVFVDSIKLSPVSTVGMARAHYGQEDRTSKSSSSRNKCETKRSGIMKMNTSATKFLCALLGIMFQISCGVEPVDSAHDRPVVNEAESDVRTDVDEAKVPSDLALLPSVCSTPGNIQSCCAWNHGCSCLGFQECQPNHTWGHCIDSTPFPRPCN